MNIKRIVLCLLGLSLAAGTAYAAQKDPAQFTMGYSIPQMVNPWFIGVKLGMEKACHELGIKCVATDAFYRVDKQVGDLERMISEHYDAILCTPIEPYALIPVYEDARKAGIATGSIAQIVPNSTLLYGMDEYNYGVSIATQAMSWAKTVLNCKGKVALITQDYVDAVIPRGNGIENTVKKLCPAMNIVARKAGDYPAAGRQIIENVLRSHPDLNLVIACNDSGGIGGFDAMIAHGKTGYEYAVFSGDATREALTLIMKPGSIYRGTVDLYPFRAGYEAAKILYRQATEGIPGEPDTRFLPYVPVSQEDVVSGKYKPAY